MKSSISRALLVLVAASSATTAQSLRVELVFDRTEVMVGETVEATLVATIDAGPEWYFWGLSTDLVASDPSLGLASTMSGLDWAVPALGYIEAGTPQGASLHGLFGGQHPLFGAVDMSRPFVIGQFTITALTPGELSYSSRWSTGSYASFHFGGPGGPWGAPAWTRELSPTETITIRPVPAPGAIGLGLAIMSLATRRRSRA